MSFLEMLVGDSALFARGWLIRGKRREGDCDCGNGSTQSPLQLSSDDDE